MADERGGATRTLYTRVGVTVVSGRRVSASESGRRSGSLAGVCRFLGQWAGLSLTQAHILAARFDRSSASICSAALAWSWVSLSSCLEHSLA